MKFTHKFEGSLAKHGEIEFEITGICFSASSAGGGGIGISWKASIGEGVVYLGRWNDEETLQLKTETLGLDFALKAFETLVAKSDLVE